MWWLLIPVIIYSALMLGLWLVLQRGNGGPVQEAGAVLRRDYTGLLQEAGAMLRRDYTGLLQEAGAALPRVSVVVAARNEEKRIEPLLESLARQDYPPELLDIIIVNDNSTDRTPIVVSSFIASMGEDPALPVPPIRLIYNPFTGKKRAVGHAIKKARGEVIITTDADCIVPPGWVTAHARWYTAGAGGQAGVGSAVQAVPVSMVVGGVIQRPGRSFWQRFGVYEFSALQAVTRATILAGRPVMAGAASMSFRRGVYLRYAAQLRHDLPSGDDMFLLHAVRRSGGLIRHDGSSAAAAVTAAAVTAAALIRQRARWASKTFHYNDAATLTLAAVTAAASAATAAAAVTACISPAAIPLAATLYALKTIPDAMLITGEMRKRGEKPGVPSLLLSALIYPFYLLLTATLSLLPQASSFSNRWKKS